MFPPNFRPNGEALVKTAMTVNIDRISSHLKARTCREGKNLSAHVMIPDKYTCNSTSKSHYMHASNITRLLFFFKKILVSQN